MNIKTGLMIASAVGLLLGTVGCDDEETGDTAQQVKCQGVNDCMGTSECATDNSTCQGLNDCKGMGWINVPTEKDCTDQGGTVI